MKQKEADMKQSEVINKLIKLTSSYSYIYILARICHRDFCGTIEELSTRNARDYLNNNEVAFLIGLWLKGANTSNWLTEKCQITAREETYALMEELHSTFLIGFGDFLKSGEKDYYEYVENSLSFKETFFYSGTGAYDYQYTKWLHEKYKHDKDWFANTLAIDFESLSPFYHALKQIQQAKLNKKSRKDNLNLNDKDVLDLFCFNEKDLIKIDKNYEPIIKKFTYTLFMDKNALKEIGDFNSFAEKPIIKLPDNRLFVPVPFCIAEALYESPFFWMNADLEYKEIALKNRGKAAEIITYKIMSRVFGNNQLFKNVKIKETKNKIVTDIDVLAVYNQQAIVFQVKSKRLTALSKKGDIVSIKSDFTKSVKDAFEQASISKDCLLENNKYQFLDSNGQPLSFKNINKCFVVVVTLDNYPAINHQAHVLLRDELRESPVALNVFDLEIVARYLDNPFKFIDYISKRILFSNYYRADNEMTYLGFHLKKGLKKHEKYDAIGLDESWAQYIDRIYYPEVAGLNAVKETIVLKKIGRNEKCPCGSEKKYKYCHGRNNN